MLNSTNQANRLGGAKPSERPRRWTTRAQHTCRAALVHPARAEVHANRKDGRAQGRAGRGLWLESAQVGRGRQGAD